jgi:hypothetical protein
LLRADEDGAGAGAGSMAERFMIPPFSVLNARGGWWQERKAAWLALGIQSELGRGENMLAMSGAANAQMVAGSSYKDANGKRSKANACPGGSPRPLDRAKAAKGLLSGRSRNPEGAIRRHVPKWVAARKARGQGQASMTGSGSV